MKHYLRKTFNPASDLSYDEYRNATLKKTLPEIIQDTPTDQEYYTLEAFLRNTGINWVDFVVV